MEQIVMQSVPQAAAIWLVMLAVAVIAVAALWLPGRRSTDDPDDPGRAGHGPADSGADRRAGQDRYAEEITVAADRAAATARRGRADWERAQQALDEAWTAFEAADRVARRSAAAAPYGVPDDAALDDAALDGDGVDGAGDRAAAVALDLADRERFLHRAATAACRRRELSMPELNDILAHRAGWDPRLHPVLQEAALVRAVRRRALATYQEAVVREKQAWHTAEVAAAALRNLREEACAAQLAVGRPTAEQLWWAGQWAPDETADTALPAAAQPEPAGATSSESESTMWLPVAPASEGDLAAAEAVQAAPAVAAGLVEVELVEAGLVEAGLVEAGRDEVGSAERGIVLATMRLPTVPLPVVQLPRAGVAVPVQAGAPAAESLREPLAVAGADGARR